MLTLLVVKALKFVTVTMFIAAYLPTIFHTHIRFEIFK